MSINIADLPPDYQRQVMEKLERQRQAEPSAKSKYHNERDYRGSIRFDSKKEARRFDALCTLLSAGAIRNLKLQPQFTLQEAYTTVEGERVRAIRYQADFSYEGAFDADIYGKAYWLLVVEDVKSKATRTRAYLLKRKMMRERYGIIIEEV